MKKKCQMRCGNKLPKDPFKVIIKGEDGKEAEPMLICDECARLIEVIGTKMMEWLDDESI